MAESYDLVVVGGGPAGYTGAIRASQLGMKVACIEKRKELGGTCLNVGCIPSKALLDSSEHFLMAKSKLNKHGVVIENLRLDLAAMMARKEGVVRQLNNGLAGLLKKHKIDHLTGTAKFKNAQTLDVDGREIKGKAIMIATGSEVIELPFLKYDGKHIISSTEALSLKELPTHLVIVGAGYIGLEMGSVWARLGSKVTVIEYADHILPFADQQLAKELRKTLEKQGLSIQLSKKCLGAQPTAKGVVVEIEDLATKAKEQLNCDLVLVCTGRRPNTDGLGLEVIDLKVDAKGFISVDESYQTAVPGVYAVGDVIGGAMLAHKAEEEAIAMVETLAGQSGHVNYGCIPSVIYTWPELAAVGKNEEELKREGVAYKVGSFPFMANARAKAMDEEGGMVKVLADAQSDRVLGVHILGPRASDLIAEAVAVMEFGGSSEDIARTCHAHPTLSEALKEAALDIDKRRLNI